MDGFYVVIYMLLGPERWSSEVAEIGWGIAASLPFCILSIVMLGVSGKNRMFYIITCAAALAAVAVLLIEMFVIVGMMERAASETSVMSVMLLFASGCYLFMISMIATAVLSIIVFCRRE